MRFCSVLHVRPARLEDADALLAIDLASWTADVSPAPVPRPARPFFGPQTAIKDVLVAEDDGRVIGYVRLEQAIPLPSHMHVLEVGGLAIDPAWRRAGAGRALVDAATNEARGRGARKLSLRVLEPSLAARRLYESSGFVVEGVLKAEFLLDGRYVDDILMARDLAASGN